MPRISIRLATEQDIDALIALYDKYHTFHVRGLPVRLRIPEETGEEDQTAYRYGYLQSLVVSESFRKHGIGQMLVSLE